MRVRMMAGAAGLIVAGGLWTGWQGAPTEVSAQSLPAIAETSSAQVNTLIPAVDDEEAGIIPNEAVRLRIIANSDSPQDQALKRQVRDRIIDDVGKRLRNVESREQARTVIQAAVPELNEAAAGVVKKAGSTYSVQTEYGMVPFPTKIYGNKVYPAGEYEALRIVIGEGQGQNWWCVLFPPLCFVDVANGDAVQAKDMDSKPLTTVQVPTGDGNTAQTVQVRLGILDAVSSFLTKLVEFVKSLFS
ncbi:stage II sporulation protein R [Effusibacillus consociatus]|uniref:Stage II sporulation protein R n=1 Tax=Effusibacillus consociatus TaxID=1117041 RepID=A0ABV9PZT5_9BACL